MLEDRFYFEQIRFSVENSYDFIIQGCANDRYMEGRKITARLGDEQLEIIKKVYKEDTIKARYASRDKEVNKGYFFIIKLPEDYANRLAVLVVSIEDHETNEKIDIYKIKTDRLKKMQKDANYCIDSVMQQADSFFVKGWVIDSEQINIEVYSGKKKLETDISWHSRGDALEQFRESETAGNIGFIAKAVVPKKSTLTIVISTPQKKSVVKVSTRGLSSGKTIVKKHYVHKILHYIKKYGFVGFVKKIILRNREKKIKNVIYKKWIKQHLPNNEELRLQRIKTFNYQPKFSIVIPLYKTPIKYLDGVVKSIKNQSYTNWELCLSDGSGDGGKLKEVLDKYCLDQRIKYIIADQPLGIADNTNNAMQLVTGDFVVLGDHDDLFTPNALYECVLALNENQEIDLIYTDEDKVDMKGSTFFEPNCKSDFNIDLLRNNNYICHMLVIKKTLVDIVGEFNQAYDGAQDYDFIFRCVEQAKLIHHIPKILYHWRAHIDSTASDPKSKMYAFEAGKRAITDHLQRVGLKATVEMGPHLGYYKVTYDIINEPLISIIIPNKDHISDLEICMNSVDSKSDYHNYEYIIIENNSTEEETFEYYKDIETRDNVHVVTWDREFNYSAINNFGVQFAKGEYLLFLNNDTEMINDECLSQLLGYCQREDVGIVGARLYFSDDSIQHAGVVVGMGGIAGHAFIALNESDNLFQSRTKVACDYSAVTAACLMTKRSLFDQVGGFEESLQVAFNDIDFCMKIRTLDKLVVYNPYAMLYHYESKSRGAENTPEKVARFNSEINRFRSRWPEIIEKGDPYYNINLTLKKSDFSIGEIVI